MKIRSATTQPATPRTPPRQVRSTPPQRLGHDLASRFEATTKKTPGYDALMKQAKRLFAGDFKDIREGLRAHDVHQIKGALASIGGRLGLAASNFTGKTPHQLLTDFGRQVVHPGFSFSSGRDLGPMRDGVCASWGRTATAHVSNKINDPDPSLRT